MTVRRLAAARGRDESGCRRWPGQPARGTDTTAVIRGNGTDRQAVTVNTNRGQHDRGHTSWHILVAPGQIAQNALHPLDEETGKEVAWHRKVYGSRDRLDKGQQVIGVSHLRDLVPHMDRARLHDPRVDTAQPQLFALLRVDPQHGIHAKALDELLAPGMRLGGHLDHG